MFGKTNLVPFKNAHFLINGLAPLNSLASGKPPRPMLTQLRVHCGAWRLSSYELPAVHVIRYRRATVLDLSQQMLSKELGTCQ